MNEKDFNVAKKLYAKLCLPSDCFDEHGHLRNFSYVVAIDDDVTSAIHAVRMARTIKEKYGSYPTILCVGGKGILSKHLYNKTEAEVLADVCVKLGYPKDCVWYEGLQKGKNTGENIRNIARFTHANYANRPTVLFCVTKRQSLRYILTQRMQASYLDARWYVIDEKLEEACKLMNAKSLCGGEMMLHEIAAILPRCQQYAGKYQEELPFDAEEIVEIKDDARYLASKYRLKLGGQPRYDVKGKIIGIDSLGLLDYCRYVRLYFSLIWNKWRIMAAIDDEIKSENFSRKMAESGF